MSVHLFNLHIALSRTPFSAFGRPPHMEDFEAFFEDWLARQEAFLDQLLLRASEPEDPSCHRRDGEADRAFKRTFLWIGDFKPTLLFRFLGSSVDGLTAAQSEVIERIEAGTRRRERELTEAMAWVLESVAPPPLLRLLRVSAGRSARNGEVRVLEAAVAELGESMVAVLEDANALRTVTARCMMEVMSPAQTVKLLATAAQFHVWIRRWGKQRAAAAAALQ